MGLKDKLKKTRDVIKTEVSTGESKTLNPRRRRRDAGMADTPPSRRKTDRSDISSAKNPAGQDKIEPGTFPLEDQKEQDQEEKLSNPPMDISGEPEHRETPQKPEKKNKSAKKKKKKEEQQENSESKTQREQSPESDAQSKPDQPEEQDDNEVRKDDSGNNSGDSADQKSQEGADIADSMDSLPLGMDDDKPFLGVSKASSFLKKDLLEYRISRPRLKGKKVTLRLMEKGDREYLRRWMANNPILNLLGPGFPQNMDSFEEWLDVQTLHDAENLLYVIEQEDDIAIGLCSLFNLDTSSRRAEYAILIGDRDYLGHNYGYEASSLILRLCFNHLNLNRIESYIPADDERAINSMQKNGFKKEGELYEHIFLDGKYRNVFLLSILRNEYLELEGGSSDE